MAIYIPAIKKRKRPKNWKENKDHCWIVFNIMWIQNFSKRMGLPTMFFTNRRSKMQFQKLPNNAHHLNMSQSYIKMCFFHQRRRFIHSIQNAAWNTSKSMTSSFEKVLRRFDRKYSHTPYTIHTSLHPHHHRNGNENSSHLLLLSAPIKTWISNSANKKLFHNLILLNI